MKQKLIIWDFDGPIVDSRKLGLELNQHRYEAIDEKVHRNLFNGNIFNELEKFKKKDLDPEEDVQFMKDYWERKADLPLVPGIIDIVSILGNEFKMVINSSSSSPQIEEYLKKNNLDGFFQKIYGNEIKDKREKFKIILDDFGALPEDCIFITDTLGDVLDAESLIIPSIVVLWGYQLKDHFDSVKDKVVFANSPSEIVELIKS